MKRFIKIAKKHNPPSFQILYQNYYLTTHPKLPCGDFTFAINTLEIELDQNGKLLYASGLCPISSWKKTACFPKKCQEFDLYLSPESDFIPGVTLSIGKNWEVYFNEDKSLLCLGNPNAHGECIMFAPNHFAIIKDDQMLALWIKISSNL